MSDHAPGTGPGIRKTIPRRRLKAAYKKYVAQGGTKPMKAWAMNGSGMPELAKKWLANKTRN
jgi:hypothetical protein